jgi:hypothetical protein
MRSKFKVGDIIKAVYFNDHNIFDDNLYYLVTHVSETTQHYKAIHLPSNKERIFYFPTAHMEYAVCHEPI